MSEEQWEVFESENEEEEEYERNPQEKLYKFTINKLQMEKPQNIMYKLKKELLGNISLMQIFFVIDNFDLINLVDMLQWCRFVTFDEDEDQLKHLYTNAIQFDA